MASYRLHCKYLHGYGVSFKRWFEGDLDHRNWVWDFGGMKYAKSTIDGMSPRDWMDYMFGYTTIVSKDDPDWELFKQPDTQGLIQLRIMLPVGAERYAEFIYDKMNPLILFETNGCIKIVKVEFREHDRDSAIFIPDN